LDSDIRKRKLCCKKNNISQEIGWLISSLRTNRENSSLISSGNYFCPDFTYLTAEFSITELPPHPPQTKGLKTKIKNNTSIKTQQDFVKKHSKFYLGQITL
jgi:hypothetical protein